MDHTHFLASLTAEDRAHLTQRSDMLGLWHLGVHLSVIVALGAAISAGIPFWWLLLPVQGIAVVFLFTLVHETTHKTPFATPVLNEVVGHVAGFLVLLPFKWFRYFHLAHHRFTNDPERDPELQGGERPNTLGGYAWHVTGLPTWAGLARQILKNATDRAEGTYLPGRIRPSLRREARWMLAGYATLTATLPFDGTLFWVWILPALLGQPFLRLYLLAEHGRCPAVANMFENTRTTFTSSMVRFLAWNMPYHAEHHAYPAVPFHKLPDLHRIALPHLSRTSDGYIRFTREFAASLGQPEMTSRDVAKQAAEHQI